MNRDCQALDRDAMHLQWLAMPDAGKSTGQIGKLYGIRSVHVRTTLTRRRKAAKQKEPT